MDKEKYQGDISNLIKKYNDNGMDGLIVYDLSREDSEHETNLLLLRKIASISEIPIFAGGNIRRLEDVKKLLYAGCSKVILNGSNMDSLSILTDASKRFGKDKLLMSLKNVDLLFKIKEILDESLYGFIVMSKSILTSVQSLSDLPIGLQQEGDRSPSYDFYKDNSFQSYISSDFSDPDFDIMAYKKDLTDNGVSVMKLTAAIDFSEIKTDANGLVPVVIQDYRTNQVLMVAYMNEESYNLTVLTGKMTYFSRSRQSLWVKGETSGHYQYVKELILDCDNDTILAKVSQVDGIACHTGAPSCFFNSILKKEYKNNNPLSILESEYEVIAGRKEHPKDGSYTNYLFDKGLDKILKKVGEEASEIIIAAKNPEKEEVKYEMADFLYHMMVLMVEKGLTWEEIAIELSNR
ncbi:MAG: bifunctional phosphoribosyl-AMP cyclohydrolase/phosphoribosyl-ATP diphosphatase HisIE [Lachnospiraceae bacterium]|nr:bifunctional phosphoribosyl-AMP cyclohydrolase/phosphoribosyl-ATP diphosphatase HisIE [Lachnospiraceae bacterium]